MNKQPVSQETCLNLHSMRPFEEKGQIAQSAGGIPTLRSIAAAAGMSVCALCFGDDPKQRFFRLLNDFKEMDMM